MQHEISPNPSPFHNKTNTQPQHMLEATREAKANVAATLSATDTIVVPTLSLVVSKAILPNLIVVSQVDRKFIFCTAGNQTLYCLDQHAVDERIKLEALEKQLCPSKTRLCFATTCALTPPVCVKISYKEADTLQRHAAIIASWGFHYTLLSRDKVDEEEDTLELDGEW